MASADITKYVRLQQPMSGGITQNIERGYVHGSRKSIIRYEMKIFLYVCNFRLHTTEHV